MSSSRAARTARGSAAAVFATFVALLMHVAAGGQMPGPLGIITPLVLSTMVCVLLAGRRLSLLRSTISVAVSQVLFHTLFVLGTTSTVIDGAAGHAGHQPTMGLATGMTTSMEHGAHAGFSMGIGHLVGAVVTVAILHRSELVIDRLATMKQFVLTPILHDLPTVVVIEQRPTPQISAADDLVLPPLGTFVSVVSRRGPPALVSA